MEVKSIRDFAKILIERTKQNFDNILIIESGSVKGTGKSSFSTDLEIEICKQMGFKFELEEIVIFDPTNEKIIDKVKNKPDGYPIRIDEASKVAYKRNYAKDEQKDLIVFVNVCRKFHKIILINNPSFWGLDKDLLDLADFRVIILKRGVAIVCGKDKNPDSKDKWRRDPTNLAVEKNPRNILDSEAMIGIFRRNDNYLFEVNFPPVNPIIYDAYEKISKEAEIAGFLENAKSTNLKQYEFEAAIGMFTYINRRMTDSLTSTEIGLIINKWIQLHGKSGMVTPDNIRKAVMRLDAGDFDSIMRTVKPTWNTPVESVEDETVGVLPRESYNIDRASEKEVEPI